MRILSLLLFTILFATSNAHEIHDSTITKLYITALENFIEPELRIHPKDKKMLVSAHCCTNEYWPEKIKGSKIVFSSFDDDLMPELEKGNMKYNGRSVILISHRTPNANTVTVNVNQWILQLQGNQISLAPINKAEYPIYDEKPTNFVFIKENDEWVLESMN